MKICFISHSASSSAAGIYEIEKALANELIQSHQCDIDVVAFNDKHFDKRDWPNANIKIFEPKYKKTFSYSRKMRNHVLSQDYDLIHLHNLWTYPSMITKKANIKNNIPIVITPNGMLDNWALNNSKYKKMIAKFFFETHNIKKASLIHVNTIKEAKDVRSLGFKNPLALIPNGVDINEIDTNEIDKLRKYNLKKGKKKRLLFLGRLHPKKGIQELLYAWKLMPKYIRSEWELVIVGWDQNGHSNKLIELTQSLDIEDSVIFYGSAFGAKKKELLKNANGFILPSFSEGLPIAVLEAWSYKLPVIMTDACNLSDGFKANAAFKISTNSDEMAESLKEILLKTDEDLFKIGVNGFDLVKSKYSWESASKKLYRSYLWILGNGSKPDEILMEEF